MMAKVNPIGELECCGEVIVVVHNPLLLKGNCRAFRAMLNSDGQIEYDENILTDPTKFLRSCDIKANCCVTCDTEYVATLTKAIEADTNTTYILEQDGDTIKLVGSDGSEFPAVIAHPSLDCAQVRNCFTAGENINIEADGTISAESSEVSCTEVRGCFSAGENITISTDGEISSTGAASETVTTLVDGPVTSLGGTTKTYTNEDGDDVTFCESFDTVTEAPCGSAGVDPEKMVRSVVRDGKELTIDVASEHCSVSVRQDYPDVSFVGQPNGTVVRHTLSVTNPSTCRRMKGLVFAQWNMNARAYNAGADLVLADDVFVNGAPVAQPGSGYNVLFAIPADHVNGVPDATDQSYPGTIGEFDIGPSGTVTVDLDIFPLAPFNMDPTIDALSAQSIQIGIIGSTDKEDF